MAQIQPSEKQFWKYVLPSMLTMLLGGFYGIVDGFFIGNAVGDDGLAAINLAWPLTALILATGTGLGVGGSVLMSIRNGEGRTQAANQAKGGALLLLAIVSVVFTLLFSLSAAQIMRFFGAEGHVLKLCVDYIQIIVYGTALQIFGVGLTPILRNTGRTVQAMVMMISGFATNIVLDWLFIMVFEWQLGGAALATIIGQGGRGLLSDHFGDGQTTAADQGRFQSRQEDAGLHCPHRIIAFRFQSGTLCGHHVLQLAVHPLRR